MGDTGRLPKWPGMVTQGESAPEVTATGDDQARSWVAEEKTTFSPTNSLPFLSPQFSTAGERLDKRGGRGCILLERSLIILKPECRLYSR